MRMSRRMALFGGKRRKKLSYYGTISNLSLARNELQSATVGDYAIFAGGNKYINSSVSSYNAVVDAYDKYLIKTSVSALQEARVRHIGASIGNYALFAGGVNSSGTVVSTVYTYNTSLTKSTAPSLSIAKAFLCSAVIGDYAIFAGGSYYKKGNIYPTSIDVYNSSLTKITANDISQGCNGHASAMVGDYALFAGGQQYGTSGYDIVNAYDTSLTRIIPSTGLSLGRYGLTGTMVGQYALFCGGSNGSGSKSSYYYGSPFVDAYDNSLTLHSAPNLSIYSNHPLSSSVGEYSLINHTKGYTLDETSKNNYHTEADAYDTSLTRTSAQNTTACHFYGSSITIGDYALFAGGYTGTYIDVVDVYQVK